MRFSPSEAVASLRRNLRKQEAGRSANIAQWLNLLLLAHAYHKMGQIERAQYFLQRCKAAKVRTPEDQETMKLAEAAKIK